MAKMNSLCDKEIIKALYEASCAGVEIELVIRGICCLACRSAGVKRAYPCAFHCGKFPGAQPDFFIFLNDGSPEVYMGSADWMPRNLDRRGGDSVPGRG